MSQIEIIRKNEQQTSTWTGGTTTQLAIYPKEAVYSERNFMWRLSSAKVEVDESTFTSLPGIWRLIMILEGELKLEHEGQHEVTLNPYEQDSFSGGWSTRSFGKVTDFNLMMGDGCQGELEAIVLENRETREIGLEDSTKMDTFMYITEAFYCVDGVVAIEIEDKPLVTLHQGDLCLVHRTKDTKDETIAILNQEDYPIHVVKVRICY